MSSDDTTDTVDRVVLNLRVDEDVKSAYEDEIVERYGAKRPYAGIELEREFRFRLDDGTLAEVWELIASLADSFGQQDRKEKNLKHDRGDTNVVRYRVAEHIRRRIISFANEHDYRSAGAFVEAIMWSYANGHGVDERVAERLTRIQNAADRELDNDLTAVERRTKSIADGLEEHAVFSMDSFEEAVSNAKGINPTRYVFEKYLPRVLDELGYTWTSAGDFAPIEEVDTDSRDPREKPYILMDADDRRLALKYQLYAISTTTTGNTGMIEVDDAHTVLDGRPQKTTVIQDLRQLAETPGFTFVTASSRTADSADDGLQINHATVEESNAHADLKGILDIENENGSQDVGNLSEKPTISTSDDPAIPDDPTQQATSWVDEVASMLAHVRFDDFENAEKENELLTAKIALKKYAEPDEDPEGGRLTELRQMVDEDDLDAVRRELGLEPTAEASKEAIKDEVEEEFAALEGADRARADGGRPMN